jgi:Amt family ammonium transporter
MFALALSLVVWAAAPPGTGTIFAQETPAPAAASEAPASPPAAAPEPAAPATPPAATLPPYMTGSSPDPEKPVWPDATGAAAGYWTTPSAGPVGDDDPSKQTPAGLYDRIAHNLFSINMIWVLLAGALVMFMQTGFALVEGGLCRAKNAGHTFAMNLMVYPLGCLAFYVYGFALGWGNWWNAPVPPGWYSPIGPGTSILNEGFSITLAGKTLGLFGTKGFFLSGMDDVSVLALFFFMMVFMDTTATIPTGTMAERWAWKNFCLFGIWVALPYCLFANWVWGGGWLAQSGLNWGLGHGAVDFAGSSVVHAMGGVIALAGGIVIGPRIGKYVNGEPRAIPGHNLPFVITGTFILAFGWFGFNAGSTLSGTDLRIATAVVNTMLASITGAISCMLYLMARGLKPDPSMVCNGMLAGLVAVTAPCAFIDQWAAALIGVISGVLVVISVNFWDRIGIDDPVGAISVHGVNGLWGTLALGLFANGKYGAGWNGVVRPEMVEKYGSDGVRGLFFGDTSQFMAQALDCGTVIIFGFSMAYVWFKVSNLITPIRVPAEDEVAGLDGPEMGAAGYTGFTMRPE